ncbi:hypothetical protein SAMN05216353_13928 [Halobacillus alkaliphilus]|uniref:Oxygen sensor histidine kinase NreB n=1 Tax=Halobacillus alkaliphilus TaxID=396056 RepID=A0A1I2REM9_9BACI|nr:GAF domain-containing sensor histidine kinase [Halobacillus alkaliphilus]SFG38920.1 hypothetical protein SAMN05216353_13928 [Halobacillus alkaliphilus]
MDGGYQRVDELNIMKVIAETLNQCNDLQPMLQTVLEKLLELTQLQAGWVFIVHDQSTYTLTADAGLPPALTWGNKQPMCEGGCHCLNRYWNGRLKEPVNIIECKRLNEAVEKEWGETEGITHHATVPLGDGEEFFGLLNVASPDKASFSDKELTLLQSLAFQIGTAIKRTRLYREEQKRAENYQRLNAVVRSIGKAQDIETLFNTVVDVGYEVFEWDNTAFYLKEDDSFNLKRARFPSSFELNEDYSVDGALKEEDQRIVVNHGKYYIPIYIHEETVGVLVVVPAKTAGRGETDKDVLKALARNLALAYERIRLQERRQELLLHEERKRLARDLHDSVNQNLFTLSLTARGVKEIIPKENQEVQELLDGMLEISQDSLKEMRSLIWQLRPVGIEEGVIAAMRKYAQHLGLSLKIDLEEVPDWSKRMEETIWRISQEAMNNVKKHTDSLDVNISIYKTEKGINMVVNDHGKGISVPKNSNQTLGLTSMKERAELMGGVLKINSVEGKGTMVHVFLPF